MELGLPLVRAANSGISAVVDGLGRETASTPLGTEDVLDAELPAALAPTWQFRFGSLGAALIALSFLTASEAGRRPAQNACRMHSIAPSRPSSVGLIPFPTE